MVKGSFSHMRNHSFNTLDDNKWPTSLRAKEWSYDQIFRASGPSTDRASALLSRMVDWLALDQPMIYQFDTGEEPSYSHHYLSLDLFILSNLNLFFTTVGTSLQDVKIFTFG